jgi:hypothetical protein
LENIEWASAGTDATTLRRALFEHNRLLEIVCTVRKDSVTVVGDGRQVIDWQRMPSQLSLSDDWKTPREDALFLGPHGC